FYLNYQGIQHYTLAQVDPRPPAADSLTAAGAGLSDKPALPLTEAERQLEREVIRVIEEEQLYLTPSVSLNDLADRLGTNRHLVSKVINAQAGRSFYDLINGYRVEHLKKLLDDPQNAPFTILALGLDSGFNSKASLNRIFKNLTGLTPRQYLDRKSQPTP
ncbi:MAG: helix-turn-helix transcriptional regulator, partial [Bacteroidota bacterium]